MDNKTPNDVKNFDFDGFWQHVKKWARKLGGEALLNALILYHVLRALETPMKSKLIAVGALVYLVLPFDLVPDLIPVAGLLDDAAALATAIVQVGMHITPEIRARAEADRSRILGGLHG